jgi:DNA-directed RNA polymerase specialized sigma24 family protein
MAVELPTRSNRRPIASEALDDVAATFGRADETIDLEEDRLTAGRTAEALSAALSRLAPQDQLLLRLRYENGLTIAQIARAFRLEQKLLYRRCERLLNELRADLERQGLLAADVVRFIGSPAVELAVFSPDSPENASVRPSME